MFVAIFVCLIYWSGLSGGFFFDDIPNILLAPGIKLQSLTTESIVQAMGAGSAGPTGRPLAVLSFALNYYFSGFNPIAFKATNLAIHLICGWLISVLARQLLSDAYPDAKQPYVSMVAAAVSALWLLHPIQLLPVLHVVQRMTSLSAAFLLAAMVLHIYGRARSGWYSVPSLLLAWGVMFPLSCFSKETGVLFPLFVLAWESIVRRDSRQGYDLIARTYIILSIIALLLVAIYLQSSRSQWLWAGYSQRPFSMLERALTESRVVWFYIQLIVVPRLGEFGLFHDDISISTSLFSPWTTLLAVVGLILLVWAAWWARKRAPLVSFGIAWFLIGHALESTLLPLEIAHEHRNYLPALGLLLVGAACWMRVLAIDGKVRSAWLYAFGGALIYCICLTALRAHQYGEPLLRTQIEVQNHPLSARVQYEAGANLLDLTGGSQQFGLEAENHFREASKLDANFKLGELGLLQLNCRSGSSERSATVEELALRLRTGPFAPGDQSVLYFIKEMQIAGTLCLKRPEVDELFQSAFENKGVSSWVLSFLYSWYADYLWLNAHDLNAARSALSESLRLNPASGSNQLKWAQLLFISGEKPAARVALERLSENETLSQDELKTLAELMVATTPVDQK